MKQSLIVLALLGGLMAPLWGQDGAQDKPKTAVVSIQTLFRGYYKTLEAQSQINAERARIQKDDNEILQRVRVFNLKLRDLTNKLKDPEVPEAERKVVAREAGLLFQEREALERLRTQGSQNRHQELNRKMVARMDGILDEIRAIVVEKSDQGGFDYVFDVEGLNTAQVPFLLYAKDATDITAMMQKELSKAAPAK